MFKVIGVWRVFVIMILCTGISFKVFGQDYVPYFKEIEVAQELVADGKYEASLERYHDVFERFTFRYARDCINAAEVSIMLGDQTSITYFIECAIERGVPISYFENNRAYADYRKTGEWLEFIGKSEELITKYHDSLNQDLRSEINDMFAEDQRIRRKYYKWYNLLWRSRIGKKWETLNKEQVERIIEITKEHGFPGERLIGVDTPNDHDKISADQFSAGILIVIFIHHYSQPNPSFDSILLEQVQKGNLSNFHYATICDFEAQYGNGKYETHGPFGLRFTSNSSISDLNQKRKSIGIPSIKVLEKMNKEQRWTRFWNRLY